jgi:hypothetical protein
MKKVDLLKKFHLMMNYDSRKTLNENEKEIFDGNLIIEALLMEGPAQTALEIVMNLLKDNKVLFNSIKADSTFLKGFATADEAILALKNVKGETKLSQVLSDVAGSLKGNARVQYLSLLKTNTKIGDYVVKAMEIAKNTNPAKANPQALKQIVQYYEKFGLSVEEIAQIASESNKSGKKFKEILDAIKNNSSSTGAVLDKGVAAAAQAKNAAKVEKIVGNASKLKAGSPEVKGLVNAEKDAATAAAEVKNTSKVAKSEGAAVSAFEKAGVQIGKYSAKTWDKIKTLYKQMSLKQLALYGLAGYGAYELLKGLFSSDKSTNGVLPACVANLPDVTFAIGEGDVVVAKIADGVDEKSNGHGGLTFYPNGRVITKDQQVKGNYYCKGTSGGAEEVSATLAEQEAPVDSTGVATPVNQTLKSDTDKYSNIHIDWDGEKKTDETPKPTTDKLKYHDCSNKDFPYEFGCIGPKIAEIQGCLGITPQKGYFGPKTRRTMKPNYDLSGGITQEIYDDVMSKCKEGEIDNRKKYDPKDLETIQAKDLKPIPTGNGLKLGDIANKIKPIESNNTPIKQGETIYKMLQSNYGDGTNPEYPYIFSELGRLKYKGDAIGGDAKNQLNQYVETLGYREEPIKEKDKDYGVKYVWVKQ